MDQFLKRQKLPKTIKGEIETMKTIDYEYEIGILFIVSISPLHVSEKYK